MDERLEYKKIYFPKKYEGKCGNISREKALEIMKDFDGFADIFDKLHPVKVEIEETKEVKE